ncbi:MAG: chromosome segregation protein SMC, partial [Bacteroidota bacterium]
MYLSKLDIIGFKSFAQKTQFKFSDGLSAVVGPNGCGKTNVVDAIRWVLGEQKTSVLRSDVMENVIFNGSRSRKPLGMAEVTLTLENNKQILPTEYTEVTISRRLFRNGESQYLLNKTKCRLRDIVDLFMDTGMGADSYSVIELKMVEAILSGRTEDRRHLFEEAAGITKYKMRRKEASRRLASVRSDLERVEDIIVEVRKNVNSLSRQAAKTRRYNKLLEELKTLDVALLGQDYLAISGVESELAGHIRGLVEEKASQEKALSEYENSLTILKSKIDELDAQYKDARAEQSRIDQLISDKKQASAVSRERISAMNSASERLKAEIEELENNFEKFTRNIEDSSEKLIQLNDQKLSIESDFEQIKRSRDEVWQMVRNLRDKAASAGREVISVKNQIESLTNNLKKNESRKDSLKQRIYSGTEDIGQLRSQIDETESERQTMNEKLSGLAADAEEKRDSLKLARERKQSIESQINELKIRHTDRKNAISSRRASLEFLSGLVDTDESSKFLIRSKDWQPTGDKSLLMELAGADEKFRIAVESALGETGRYFVVDSLGDAYAAVKELKDKQKGKATFICREKLPNVPAPEAAPEGEYIYGWASEIVRTDDALRSALREILGRTLIVDNTKIASEMVDSGRAVCAVTLDGELVRKGGIIRGGTVSKTEGRTVGKKERMDKLTAEIEELRAEAASIESEIAELTEEGRSIDLDAMRRDTEKTENEIKHTEQEIARQDLKLESLGNKIANIEENLERFNEEIAEAEAEESDMRSDIAG